MKTKKSTAFWATFWALLGVYGFTALVIPSALSVVGPTIIGALAFAGFGYQAAQVGDAWQKSSHYRPELDREEEGKKKADREDGPARIPRVSDGENG